MTPRKDSIPPHVRAAIIAAQDKMAEDVVLLDLAGLGAFTDYFLVCTGFSTPQLEAVIRRKGYVTGVAAQSFLDKKTGFRDAGFGLDVVDWGSDCVIVPDCRKLPFPNASFDTVCFIACLNHIPERREAALAQFAPMLEI